MTKLKSLRLAGWKSIRDSDIELRQLNVVVGPNGSGKSNLVAFFKMLNEMIGSRLQVFISTSGGADSLLHYGSKTTPVMNAALDFETETGDSLYSMRLAHAAVDTLIFTDESIRYKAPSHDTPLALTLGSGHRETRLNEKRQPTRDVVRWLLRSCRVFQFHDTSSTAKIRQQCYVADNQHLMPNGGNLAAMLYHYRQSEEVSYRRIINTVRQIAPFFDDFDLAPMAGNENSILLNWREKGVESLFGPHQISDGTLRAMALITLLSQPESTLPTVIVIDEPELGLHPYAIGVLASLLKKVSHRCQVVVATQSATLLDHFDPNDIIVVERKNRESEFERLSAEKLKAWLDEYLLSELWEKNVFGGGPY